MGEIFMSQTSDYTHSFANEYWAITPATSSFVLRVHNYNLLNKANPMSDSLAARPTIHLKSEIVIKSGSGTEQDPFVVGLPS